MITGSLRQTSSYIKTGALALMISLGSCSRNNAPLITKDVVEFAAPTAAKLIERMENGARYAKTIYVDGSKKDVIRKNEMKKFKTVHDTIIAKLKTLPDTIDVYYQVYKGKADDAIQKALKKKTNLVTVAHGNTGRDSITLAGNKKAGLGDYISQFQADSLFNSSLIEKDSILKANLSRKAFKKLKQHQKDAILSYLYNVNETLLLKRDKSRAIPESFFDCLENYAKGDKSALAKAQSKFNVKPSSKVAAAGLDKRNLVNLLIFGDGEIYHNEHTYKNLYRILDVLKKRKDCDKLLKEVYTIVTDYGVSAGKLEKTKQKIQNYVHPELIKKRNK